MVQNAQNQPRFISAHECAPSLDRNHKYIDRPRLWATIFGQTRVTELRNPESLDLGSVVGEPRHKIHKSKLDISVGM